MKGREIKPLGSGGWGGAVWEGGEGGVSPRVWFHFQAADKQLEGP